MQLESQLPRCKQHGAVLQTITIILTTLRTSARESLGMYLILSNSKYLSCSYIVQAGDSGNHRVVTMVHWRFQSCQVIRAVDMRGTRGKLMDGENLVSPSNRQV